ncbi:MAG TPA: hypothetical protein VMY42_03260 [Thermoguttaceae bacterium]|nr:hypothetical protein [Thermoguttaceae bacterium]
MNAPLDYPILWHLIPWHLIPWHPIPWRHILWAQGDRFEGLSRGFKGRRIDSGELVTSLLIVLSILLAVWLLSYTSSLRERRGAYASPLRLFLSLCKAHRLAWSEQWLLWRVAKAQRLRDPARLFLEPDRLEPQNLDPSSRMRMDRIKRLRDRLFADLGQ